MKLFFSGKKFTSYEGPMSAASVIQIYYVIYIYKYYIYNAITNK